MPITASADGSVAGNAAVFYSGSNSFIRVPDSDSLDVVNALTVEAWIKPGSGGGEWALIMGKQWNSADANPWYSYRLLAASANPSEQGFPRKVAFQIAPEGSGEPGVESTPVGQNDVWTHVAGVYDGSSVKIYINGELEGSNPVTGSIRTSDLPLYLGKAPWTNFNNYNGMIDEVRVWNVARTAAQIDYDMRHTLTGDEPGLVGYWNFDEVSGNTAADATDNSNDGTLNNGAAFAASDTLLSLPDETEIIVANTDNHSIDFFHIAADGNAAPSRTIKGSSTNLNRPVDVALYDGKLYVLNHVAHAIEVFDPAATGDTAPVRRIIGGMSYPSGFDFDTTTQEIFVANYSGDITVYNASDSGIVTPKRTIAKHNAMTVAVSGNELFVTTYTEPAVYVYNKTTGNLLRTIQGANTGLSGNLYGVAISDGELFISDAVNNAIHVFNLTDSGDTEPKRTISGSNTLLGMPRELHIVITSFILPIKITRS
jgi:6-phosphogluconolactonase (cycloisomerase 2 family)